MATKGDVDGEGLKGLEVYDDGDVLTPEERERFDYRERLISLMMLSISILPRKKLRTLILKFVRDFTVNTSIQKLEGWVEYIREDVLS